MLYHGTVIGGLDHIKANSKSHTTGKPAACFTEDRCYALVCCRSREENFVTMGLREDGKQHYYERFPDQLKVLYKGRRGYLYLAGPSAVLANTRGHTWESVADVPVSGCEVIEDVYAEILNEEARGNLVIHRYREIDPAEQQMHADYIKAHLGDQGEAMGRFYQKHFSSLWS